MKLAKICSAARGGVRYSSSQRAADHLPKHQYELAMSYLWCGRVKQAAQLFERAAEQGRKEAQLNLAKCYGLGGECQWTQGLNQVALSRSKRQPKKG